MMLSLILQNLNVLMDSFYFPWVIWGEGTTPLPTNHYQTFFVNFPVLSLTLWNFCPLGLIP